MANYKDLMQEDKDCEVTIQRSPHDKENPYTMIRNDILKSKVLSLEGRAFLSYLLTFPSSWNFHVTKLVKELNVGKNKIYSLLNELIKHGYCETTRHKNGNLLAHVTYKFYENPISNNLSSFRDSRKLDSTNEFVSTKFNKSSFEDIENTTDFKKCFRHSTFRELELRGLGNPPLLNTIDILNTKKKKENARELIAFRENVFLTQKQHDALIERFGKDLTESYYEKLSNYIFSKGKSYKSHYHTILMWNDSNKEKNISSKPLALPSKKIDDVDEILANKEYAKLAIASLWNKCKEKDIFMLDNGIYLTIGNDKISYDSKLFKQDFKVILNKYNLDIPKGVHL